MVEWFPVNGSPLSSRDESEPEAQCPHTAITVRASSQPWVRARMQVDHAGADQADQADI